MLIEPTETEIARDARRLRRRADRASPPRRATIPDLVHAAPHTAPVRRLDETTAARQPNLRWRAMTGSRDALPGLIPGGHDASRHGSSREARMNHRARPGVW